MRHGFHVRVGAFALLAAVFLELAACGGDGGNGGDGAVNLPPSALFTADPTSGPSPLTVTLDASASTDPDGSITGYAWDFGDQTAAGSGVRLEHVYSAAGSYTITLTVTDNRGATASATRGVTATTNAPPVARFTIDPERGVAPLVVRVDAAESSDPDGAIAHYAWDFADGTTATGVSVEHTYAEPGEFRVRFTVTDELGATGSTESPVLVMSRVAARRYEVVEIPSLGGWYTEPSAINNRGEVTGFSYFDGTDVAHAFLYSGGITRDLGTLGGPVSYGRDVNDDGEVVGYSETAARFDHAFVYRDGSLQDLGTLGGFYSEANAISAAGRIVGTAEDRDGFYRAFVYEGGPMTALPIDAMYARGEATNDVGMIAGEFTTPQNEVHAFVFGSVFMDIGTLGGDQAYAQAINARGDVVGISTPPGAGFTGFLYRDGVMRELVPTYSEPNDLNDGGVVVGYAHFGIEGRAFVWDAVNGIQDLNALIDPQLGWTLQVAAGINDLGQIVGHGSRAGGAHVAVLLTPVF